MHFPQFQFYIVALIVCITRSITKYTVISILYSSINRSCRTCTRSEYAISILYSSINSADVKAAASPRAAFQFYIVALIVGRFMCRRFCFPISILYSSINSGSKRALTPDEDWFQFYIVALIVSKSTRRGVTSIRFQFYIVALIGNAQRVRLLARGRFQFYIVALIASSTPISLSSFFISILYSSINSSPWGRGITSRTRISILYSSINRRCEKTGNWHPKRFQFYIVALIASIASLLVSRNGISILYSSINSVALAVPVRCGH